MHQREFNQVHNKVLQTGYSPNQGSRIKWRNMSEYKMKECKLFTKKKKRSS